MEKKINDKVCEPIADCNQLNQEMVRKDSPEGVVAICDNLSHNAQYAPIEIKPFNKAHDRFLIIDDKVYHIGASLKDLGKKWFAFSLMNDLAPEGLISRL